MESGDSFDLGSLVFSPIDEGLPFAPPASSPPPPPLLPNHTNGDLPQSAAAVELQGWELPVFRSNPTPQELVLNHLAPAIDRLKLSKGGSRSLPSRPSVVNTGLPLLNPWEIPGISLQEGRREKYYFTDRHDLCFTGTYADNLEAPDGFWKLRGWVWGLKNETCSGPNFTHEFYGKGHLSGMGVGSKTNWIMDVYSLITEDGFIQGELVLCHVFADDGQSRKRKKNRSDVWDYFTKIYARDRNGEVLTYAACNHCFKLLTGGSSGGTNHLHRHKRSCPCKLQPVEAGRNAQADVNVLAS